MIGFFNMLKPPGMTSHDVVSRLRRITGIRKIGHAGTLDPEAAGVLPVGIGFATKMIPYLDHSQKTYLAEMVLGVTSDTQDLTGRIISTDEHIPDERTVREVLMGFVGTYWQVPPMYSAVKRNGKKLYELARRGETVSRSPRLKTIYGIDWLAMNKNCVRFNVICSEGTYIRTLCHDIGQQLKCGAALGILLRTQSCGFGINEAVTLEELDQKRARETHLIPVDTALRHYPPIIVQGDESKALLHGAASIHYALHDEFVNEGQTLMEGYVRVYLSDRFFGIGQMHRSQELLIMKKRIAL